MARSILDGQCDPLRYKSQSMSTLESGLVILTADKQAIIRQDKEKTKDTEVFGYDQ